jgi:hypothetical protein
VPRAVTPKLGEVGSVSGESVTERQDVATAHAAPERVRLPPHPVQPPTASAEAQEASHDEEVRQAAHRSAISARMASRSPQAAV